MNQLEKYHKALEEIAALQTYLHERGKIIGDTAWEIAMKALGKKIRPPKDKELMSD